MHCDQTNLDRQVLCYSSHIIFSGYSYQYENFYQTDPKRESFSKWLFSEAEQPIDHLVHSSLEETSDMK